MPQPNIYPGSLNEIQDQLEGQQNFGGPDMRLRDPFNAKLTEPTKLSPPLLCYPIDLGSTQEYQFSIRFDIYETGGDTLNQKRSWQDGIAASIQRTAQENQGDLSLSQIAQLGEAAIAAPIDAISAMFSGATAGIANVSSAGKGRDYFVEEATGLGNLTTPAGNVYMYLPGAISIGYKFEYENADLTAMDILKGLRSLTETQTGAGAVAQAEIARKMGMSALKVADDIGELVGGKDGISNALSAAQRQVQNPFVVHMFKGVGRRTFRFGFTMLPRSEKEAIAIENITTVFRKYAHPKRSEGGRFLDFPAEFNITFLHRNQENIRIPKIRKCALTGINLVYGENTFTATQTDSLGMVNPTKVTMELEFTELELLVQQSVTDQGA